MTIIDTHQHFWWIAKRPHEWPAAVGDRLDRDYTPDDLAPQLARAGVDGTILIQSLNDPDETLEYLALSRQTPWVRGVVGWMALDRPDDVPARLATLRRAGKLVGFRHLLRVESAKDWLAQPQVLDSLQQVAEAGLVFELVPVNAEQFAHVFDFAEKIPNLRLVIDHLGRPPVPEKGWEPWAGLIRRAAEHSNIALKLSTGIAMIASWRWDTEALRRYVDHAIACFGPERVMAASNWPVVELAGSYQEVWSGLTTLVAGLGPDGRRAALGGNAARIYRLT
ncbi:MAG: hypothetical protein C3F17_15010 [Bradyrhizobiaceae bacterium]|nr:MAG: hypothetical protein C3F17_15010 [Bradyrhizobiaceae bacterium]